jgi:hypothetical protein
VPVHGAEEVPVKGDLWRIRGDVPHTIRAGPGVMGSKGVRVSLMANNFDKDRNRP